ncbi:MAG: hypothetical protein MH321_14900 [Leptospiraceae bacterium]|nr:hypothetical protein [Leptospiraceae bacterium]
MQFYNNHRTHLALNKETPRQYIQLNSFCETQASVGTNFII